MYTAVDNIHILVVLWNIVKRLFSLYCNVFCIIIPCIRDVAYSFIHFDVSYVSVGQNIQPEFALQELGYATWRYGCILNGLIGTETLEEDTEYPVCATKIVFK